MVVQCSPNMVCYIFILILDQTCNPSQLLITVTVAYISFSIKVTVAYISLLKPTYQTPVALTLLSINLVLFETGIKVVDLLTKVVK
jgi:hypothetical protein